MKKQSLKLSGLIVAISLLLRIIYLVILSVYKYNQLHYYISEVLIDSIGSIFYIIALILLAIGMIMCKKEIIIASCSIDILSSVCDIIGDIGDISRVSDEFVYVIVGSIFAELSAIVLSIAMMLFFILVFKRKEENNNINASVMNLQTVTAVSSPYQDNSSTLIQLKELLDMGAITQEEFDTKKKELL